MSPGSRWAQGFADGAADGMAMGRRAKEGAASGGGDAPATPLTVSRPALLVDGSDRTFRRLVHGLFGFLARHEALRAGHAAMIGLAGIEYSVLIAVGHLDAQEGSVGVNRVAAHLHLSGAFVTTVTNRLQSLGLVHKDPDPADRRRVRLRVSDPGWERLARLAPSQRQVNDVEFGCLERAEFLALVETVERLIGTADQAMQLQAFLAGRGETGTSSAPAASSAKQPRKAFVQS